MEVAIPRSKNLVRSTMPELIALKLLALATRGLQTIQIIKTKIERTKT